MEKLVRDKIISKIIWNGENPNFRQVSGQERLGFLFKKLVEEALELQSDRNMEELADVEEVLLALYEELWWTREEVTEIRLKKLEKNGGFKNGDILKI